MFIPVLAAVIRNAVGDVLLAQRRVSLANGGLWEFPGGKLQKNETPFQGLRREIQEEMGVEIEVLRPFHIVNFTNQNNSILLMAFEVRLFNNHFKLVDHTQIEWVSPLKLLTYPLSPADIEVARLLYDEALQG